MPPPPPPLPPIDPPDMDVAFSGIVDAMVGPNRSITGTQKRMAALAVLHWMVSVERSLRRIADATEHP